MIFNYKGQNYPEYLKDGNACQYIAPVARKFCYGVGLDIGAGKWPLKGAIPVDIQHGMNAMSLPAGEYDYIFSSHCLEHLENPITALEHWKTKIKNGGVLFLYLPHPEMEYWLPQNNRKHLHSWQPREIVKILKDLGFTNVLHSERDLAWSFAVVAINEKLQEVSYRKRQSENDVNERLHTILDDPQLLKIYQQFGSRVFHRCSVFHNLNRILLKNGVKGKQALEIGTYNGITAIILARYFEHVISVDIMDCPVKQEIADFLEVKNIDFMVVKDNKEKAEFIKSQSFDFCYMDGDHENDTLTDWELVKHCGHVLFHEYWSEQPSVFELVNSLPENEVKKFPFMALWRK